MNKSLMMLVRHEADIVPCCTHDKYNWEGMKKGISSARLRSFIVEEKEAKSEGEWANTLAQPSAPKAEAAPSPPKPEPAPIPASIPAPAASSAAAAISARSL